MKCNCKWTEIILAIIIFVLTVWPEIFGVAASMWIVAIAAVLLFVHALTCKNCGKCMPENTSHVTHQRNASRRRRR